MKVLQLSQMQFCALQMIKSSQIILLQTPHEIWNLSMGKLYQVAPSADGQ